MDHAQEKFFQIKKIIFLILLNFCFSFNLFSQEDSFLDQEEAAVDENAIIEIESDHSDDSDLTDPSGTVESPKNNLNVSPRYIQKGVYKRDKEMQGSEARDRGEFQDKKIPKSVYKYQGEQLQVDPN